MFEVLYQDASVLAVNKPAGVTVIPARDEPPEDSLRLRLEASRGEKLWVVHRIDRDTSGVVLFARDAAAHRTLSAAFEARAVRKHYVALCRGAPPSPSGSIAAALHGARKGKMRPALPDEPGALACTTEYELAGTWPTLLGDVSRIEARPLTGRQHQVRVHLRSMGCALLVDPLYGRCAGIAAAALGAGSPAVTRLTLHARRIELARPRGAGTLTIEAPLAPDLAALLAWLASPRAGEGDQS